MSRIVVRLQKRAAHTGAARTMYAKTIADLDGVRVQFSDGADQIMLATYDYLGLLGHPRISQAAKNAVDAYGTGCHGSRVGGASLTLHTELEAEIARWTGRESAIVMSSGFATNYSVISSLLGPGDWLLSDQLNHASIIDGCAAAKHTGATLKVYRHNDMAHLEELLQQAPPGATKLVIADGVFSMDGDLFDLPTASELCRRFGALLFVDEAHSLGVIGPHGGGIEDHYAMPGTIDLLMGTLSKTIPSAGGFIAGSHEVIEALRQSVRAYVFSGAISPPTTAAALESIRLLQEEGVQRRTKLRHNIERLVQRLQAEGLRATATRSAIVPVILGEPETAVDVAQLCQERGVFIVAVGPPVVQPGTARLRLNVTAAHSTQDIDTAAAVIADAVRQVVHEGRAPGVSGRRR
ncbi:aminotransferase class I/II-fold pyridoxal phosphate-dependent enzyme [Streptomyces rectiverticillatus]|uniref:aminotransferase class I/II-fold pyridoxal phosphate-dependent enzyme n=1 Tax=Streptomyces rectiverticillatus TaxID=173860 RepID=UPI0015C395B8|nr:aminotransferase class I/II-fold pyridoxal phosphate-dependent enzyme [Streptomyces rectiverticillatus]QLE75619.1 aminotransferase class I/II-fold pyridoxal phosphate-dependent enzyme [Streptomyces rectiverticillatus]